MRWSNRALVHCLTNQEKIITKIDKTDIKHNDKDNKTIYSVLHVQYSTSICITFGIKGISSNVYIFDVTKL